MARTITGTLSIRLAIDDVNDNGIGKERLPIEASHTKTFVSGGGASNPLEIDELYQAKRTLAGGANEELDLTGVLTGNFGLAVAFTKVKLIYIELEQPASNPSSGINVGGAAVNAFSVFGDVTDVLKVQKGGALCLVSNDPAGYPVTAGTGDKLKITNADGANSATYKIVILGNK